MLREPLLQSLHRTTGTASIVGASSIMAIALFQPSAYAGLSKASRFAFPMPSASASINLAIPITIHLCTTVGAVVFILIRCLKSTFRTTMAGVSVTIDIRIHPPPVYHLHGIYGGASIHAITRIVVRSTPYFTLPTDIQKRIIFLTILYHPQGFIGINQPLFICHLLHPPFLHRQADPAWS